MVLSGCRYDNNVCGGEKAGTRDGKPRAYDNVWATHAQTRTYIMLGHPPQCSRGLSTQVCFVFVLPTGYTLSNCA